MSIGRPAQPEILAAPIRSTIPAILEGCWLLGLVAVPLLVNPSGGYAFSIYKATFFRMLVGLMAAAWTIRAGLLFDLPPEDWRQRVRRLRCAVRRFLGTPLNAPVLALALAYILAAALSISPSTSLWGAPSRMEGTYTTLALVAFFLVLSWEVRTRAQLNRVVWAILLGSGLVSLLGIAELLGWSPWLLERPYDTSRVGATIGNPTALGAYLVLPMALLIGKTYGLWVSRADQSPRTLALKFAGLSTLLSVHLAALVFTGARGAWLGFAVTIAVFVGVLLVKDRKWWALGTAGIVFALGILFAVGLSQQASILGGLRGLPYLSRVAEIANVGSTTIRARVLIWDATKDLFVTHPAIRPEGDPWGWARPVTGYGPETLQLAFESVYPSDLRHLGTRLGVDRAHNIILDLAVTVGLLGLLAFGWLVVSLLFQARRLLGDANSKGAHLLLLALVAGVAGYLATLMVGISALADQLLFWSSLALVAALARGTGELEHSQPSQQTRSGEESEQLTSSARDEESEQPARSARGEHVEPYERSDNPAHPEPVEGSERDDRPGEDVRLSSRSPSAGKKAFVGVTAFALGLSVLVVSARINTDLVFADILTRKGSDLFEQGRWVEAASSFEQALAPPALRAFNNWYLAQAYSLQALRARDTGERLRLLELASTRIEAARALEPAAAAYHQRAGLIYTYWTLAVDPSKYQAAVEAFAEAAAVSPREVSIYNQWADLEARLKNYDRSLELLRRSVDADPDWAPTHYQVATLYAATGQTEAAAAARQRSLELCPSLWQMCLDLAEELVLAGRPADARPYVEPFVEGQPQRWEGRFLLAQVYSGLGMTAAAREHATAALSLAPDSQQEQVRRLLDSLR